MKYLKKFNEAVSSNSELEEKLRTIIDSIENSEWAPPNEWYYDEEVESKKSLFDIEVKNIKFEECETKLNKLCYDFNGFDLNVVILDEDMLYDIQVTYDSRGIVVMSGLLTDNPKVLDIFHKDVSIDDIKLEIVQKIMENIIKYSEPKKLPYSSRDYSTSGDLGGLTRLPSKMRRSYPKPISFFTKKELKVLKKLGLN